MRFQRAKTLLLQFSEADQCTVGKMSFRLSIALSLLLSLVATVSSIETGRALGYARKETPVSASAESDLPDTNETSKTLEPLTSQEYESKYDGGILDGIDKLKKEGLEPTSGSQDSKGKEEKKNGGEERKEDGGEEKKDDGGEEKKDGDAADKDANEGDEDLENSKKGKEKKKRRELRYCKHTDSCGLRPFLLRGPQSVDSLNNGRDCYCTGPKQLNMQNLCFRGTCFDALRAKKYRREKDQDEEGLCEFSSTTEDQVSDYYCDRKEDERDGAANKFFMDNDARIISPKGAMLNARKRMQSKEKQRSEEIGADANSEEIKALGKMPAEENAGDAPPKPSRL